MKIICRPDGDTEWAEEHDSIEAVEEDLKITAEDDYRSMVMWKLHAGETYFTVANGPDETDVWEVLP